MKAEQQAVLLNELSKVYEVGRGGDRKTDDFKEDKMTSLKEDVNDKTSKETGVSSKTVQRARAFVKAVKKNPKKYQESNWWKESFDFTEIRKVNKCNERNCRYCRSFNRYCF